MRDITIFNFDDLEVRTLAINEEPFFVGKDVAEALGYARPDNEVGRHVDKEDKLIH